jgi:cytoskeletal protein RodZ
MTIEMLIGIIVVAALVAFFVFKPKKEEVDQAVEAVKPEPVPKVEAETKTKPAPKVEAETKKVATKTTKKTTKNTPPKTTATRGPKKTGVTKTDLNKMNKDQLETFAKKEYKVDLDKRKKKADLVDEVLGLANKK